MTRTRGYTLAEMLVAITIVVVLAAVFLPVLSQAKEEGKQAVCVMNFKQVGFASTIYQADYDDRYVLPKYVASDNATWENDRTWVQLVSPYLRDIRLTRCPSDFTRRGAVDTRFDAEVVVGANSEAYYQASQRANTGLNSIYLSPLVREDDGRWGVRPRSSSEVNQPSTTLVLGDSVWDVLPGGRPIGGGSYLIVPPCRYVSADGSDSFMLASYEDTHIYTAQKVWDDPVRPATSKKGGLWAWHSGRITTEMADSSVKVRSVQQLIDGCSVRANWGGKITDTGRYIWDLR